MARSTGDPLKQRVRLSRVENRESLVNGYQCLLRLMVGPHVYTVQTEVRFLQEVPLARLIACRCAGDSTPPDAVRGSGSIPGVHLALLGLGE